MKLKLFCILYIVLCGNIFILSVSQKIHMRKFLEFYFGIGWYDILKKRLLVTWDFLTVGQCYCLDLSYVFSVCVYALVKISHYYSNNDFWKMIAQWSYYMYWIKILKAKRLYRLSVWYEQRIEYEPELQASNCQLLISFVCWAQARRTIVYLRRLAKHVGYNFLDRPLKTDKLKQFTALNLFFNFYE